MQYTEVSKKHKFVKPAILASSNLEILSGNRYSRSASAKLPAISGYDIKIINLSNNTTKVYRYRRVGFSESISSLPDDIKIRGKRELSLIDLPNNLLREYSKSSSSKLLSDNPIRQSMQKSLSMYYKRLAASAGVPIELAFMTAKIPYDDEAITILVALKSMRQKKSELVKKLAGVNAMPRRKAILEDFVGADISSQLCMTDSKKVDFLINYMLA